MNKPMQTSRCVSRIVGSVLLLLAAAWLATSCGGGSFANYVGKWQGTTSQNSQLSFEVHAQQNTNVSAVFCFQFSVTGSQFRSLGTGCDSNALTFPFSSTTFNINQAPTFTVTGQFISPTQATGTITDTTDPTPLNLTWMASKN
jgi:hypothetical protein